MTVVVLEDLVGTWGSGPFQGDSALDFIDLMGPLSRDERQGEVEQLFTAAIEDGRTGRTSVLPEEVLAAAAVVAASWPSGTELPWNADVPSIAEWLPQPVPARLRSLALQALETSLPPGGWWWESWRDPGDREDMERVVKQIERVLRQPVHSDQRSDL